MIALYYINSEGKTIRILFHEKIIVGYLIANGWIEISFTSTPAVVKEKKPTVYSWSFKVLVSQITNFVEVETFLKSIKKPEQIKPSEPTQTQTAINF